MAARDAYNAEYTAFKKQHRPASKIAPAVRKQERFYALNILLVQQWHGACLWQWPHPALIVQETRLRLATAGSTASGQLERSR